MLLKAESCPERPPAGKRASQLDRHISYLAQRWSEGCHNAAEMYRELRRQGFRGSESAVRQLVGQWRATCLPS